MLHWTERKGTSKLKTLYSSFSGLIDRHACSYAKFAKWRKDGRKLHSCSSISLPPKCWTVFSFSLWFLNFCLLHRIWRHWRLLYSGMWHHADWYINTKIFGETCCLHLQNPHQHHCGNFKSCFLWLTCYWLLLICLQL